MIGVLSMTIEIASEDLESRRLRENLLGGADVREIVGVDNNSGGLLGGLLGGFIDALFNIGGWIVKGIFGVLDIGFSAALGFVLGTLTGIATLNWNTSDEDIQKKIDTLNQGSLAQLGGLVGSLAAWIACGLLPAGGIMTINQLAGLYVGIQVGEEAIDDLVGQLANTIKILAKNEAQKMTYHIFKNTRKAIKKWNRTIPAESWEREALDRFFGNSSKEQIEQWGNPQGKPWTIQGERDTTQDTNQNNDLKSFWDEFWDEAKDTCVEALYIVANSLDNFVLQQKMIADEVNGEQVVVQVQPDREIDDNREVLTLAGGANHIRSQLPQVMTNYQMVENRDIGQWVGETIRDSTRANPSELTVRLMLYSEKRPPYSKAEQSATITLHDFKRSKLDWLAIKKAIGGKTGYTYGRFRATAKLDSGRQLVVYASTENEAEDRINALEELIEPDIEALNITEEKRTGARANGKPLQKQPIKIYPAYLYIQSKQRILNQGTNARGFQTLDGTWNSRRFVIELFPEREPDDFDRVVADALRTPGI